MTKKYKLGLDLHGVSDKIPEFFALIANLLIDAGHEVHLMTGEHEGPYLDEQIKKCGLVYTHLFSIADWHKKRGTDISYDTNGNPWMDSKTWDSSKALYAEEEGIDLVIDDTARYGTYFKKTIFMATDIQLPGDKAQQWLNHRRKGMEIATENKTWIRKDRDLVRDGFPNVVGVYRHKAGSFKSFQDIVDATYDQGIDLYKVYCETHTDEDKKQTYHFFMTEPFSNAGEWWVCAELYEKEKDRRLWSE